MNNLNNKRVAILATNGFEESELVVPMNALKQAGAIVDIISETKADIQGWANGNWSNSYSVDKTVDEASVSDYHALLLPGGVINPDKLRRNEKAVKFTRSFFENHKPVGAICHAPQILAEADVLKGKKITSFHSIKKDMINAGANWVNEEVVVDSGLVTSRSPQDMNAFCSKLVEEVAEGKHEELTV